MATVNKSPRISILFPVFNGAKFLRQTLDTVISQAFTDWELIAQDGGSTDGTLEIFKEYSAKYPNIKVFSEPDENGFHAIHKASEKANGEFFYFLCSSDGYLDNTWYAKCVESMDADPQLSLVWGIPFQITEDGRSEGPNFIYAHFLESKSAFSPLIVLKKIIRKMASPLEFIKKLNTANVKAVSHMVRHEPVPQKQDWFSYWLKTGTMFPDGNMCMSRKVFMECFPKYELGSKIPGDFTEFSFQFNTRGFLARCIPIPANFGRTHAGQTGERVKEYNDRVSREYFKRLEKFRAEAKPDKKVFIDRAGNPIT